MLTMLTVVGLEIIVGIGHEALQLTTQQQIGHHVAGIVGKLVSGTIAHGDRDMVGIHRCLETEINLLEGIVGLLALINHDGLVVIVVMIDEEKTVAEGLAFLVDNDEVAHTRGQLRLVDGQHSATRDGLKILQHATTEHGHAILSAIGQTTQADVGLQLIVHSIKTKGTACVLGLGQVEGVSLAMPHKARPESSVGRHIDREEASALVGGLNAETVRAIRNPHPALNILHLAILIGSLESHGARLTGNEMTALGIEINEELFLEFLLLTGLGTTDNILRSIVTGRLGTLIDRNHARVDTIELAEEVLCHLFIIEQLGIFAAIMVLADAEVQHPAGIGAQLIEAGIDGVLEDEVAIAITLFRGYDILTFDHHAVRRHKFHIEDVTHVGIG